MRERDGVVAAESDEAGKGFAGLGVPGDIGIGRGGAGEEGVVAVFDLVEGVGVVVGGDGDVAAVEDGGPAVEWVCVERHVVAAVEIQTARALTDPVGPKASAGAIGGSGVEWSPNEGNVEFFHVARKTWEVG